MKRLWITKLNSIYVTTFLVGTFAFLFSTVAAVSPIRASETIKLSCSAQVYEIIRGEFIKNFTDQTGVNVEFSVYTSHAAVTRLVLGESDVAATAQRLANRYKHEGLLEFPFCKEALAIIINPVNTITNITEEQLRGIFVGTTTNWKEVGGADKSIIVVAPDKKTALYRNFRRMFMQGMDVNFHILTAKSTDVVEVTRRFRRAVSFVNLHAVQDRPEGTKFLKVNGVGPCDPNYPYMEVFSLATRGKPVGAAKKLVDFAFSEGAVKIINKHGMVPCK